MHNMTIDRAMAIIKQHQSTAPIDIISIASALDINIYTAIGTENLSGKIVKDKKLGGKSGYAIFVNNADIVTRQRFTVAHEIAHFLLHKEEIGDGIVDDALYRSNLSNKQEAEANKLAADILMPWNLINHAMNKGLTTISSLSKLFQVSESAMSIRLGVPS